MPRKFSGQKLREIREEKGFSRHFLAWKIDNIVGPSTIHRYESGKSVPQVNVYLRLADALGVNPGKIIA